MTASLSDVTVSIVGKQYHIKCPSDKIAELQESALFLDEKMSEVKNHSKMVGIDRIAVIAALNVAHELMVYKKQKSNYIELMNQRIQALQKKIEAVLGDERQ